MRPETWHESKRLAITLSTLVFFIGSVGCAAKVNQDVFDQEIASIRGDISDLDTRVTGNTDRIDSVEGQIVALRQDLEALQAEFGELETQITEIEDGLRFAMPVHFEFDRADIRPADRPLLERFARVVSGYYEDALITVEGFADPAGPAAYNLDLSERRAQSVADFLTREGGLDPAGIRTVAYGEDRQVVPGAQGPGRAGLENRRVAFVIDFGGELQGVSETVATAGS